MNIDDPIFVGLMQREACDNAIRKFYLWRLQAECDIAKANIDIMYNRNSMLVGGFHEYEFNNELLIKLDELIAVHRDNSSPPNKEWVDELSKLKDNNEAN